MDFVLADPGFGSPAMIGSEVGDQLLVMVWSLVRATARPSREVSETFPTVCLVPSYPFGDCRATGSEDSGGVGNVLSMVKEEPDHRPADGLRFLGVSDPLIVRFIGSHGITSARR